MGDPVICQVLCLLQAPGGSKQEALSYRGECIQIVLRQAVLRADTYGARARPARLQPLHKQRAASIPILYRTGRSKGMCGDLSTVLSRHVATRNSTVAASE